MNTDLSRVIAARYSILILGFGCSAVLSGGRGDWNYFVELGRQLVSEDGLGFYRIHGDAQTGALSLLVAAALSITPRNGFVASVVISGLIGLWGLFLTERQVARQRGASDTLSFNILLSGLVLCAWWGKLGAFGHLDDATVLGLALIALHEHDTGRHRRAGVAVGLAIAFKPWAVFFLPLSLPNPLRPGRHRSFGDRASGVAAALVVGAMAWLPFIIAEPTSLRRLTPTVLVADDSVLRLVGLESFGASSGLRITQLASGLLVALALTLTGKPQGALPAAIAMRMALDPGTWHYYTAGLVLACIVWQLRSRDDPIPWLPIAVSICLAPEYFIPDPTVRASLRLCALVGVIGVTSVAPRRHDRAQCGGLDAEWRSSSGTDGRVL